MDIALQKLPKLFWCVSGLFIKSYILKEREIGIRDSWNDFPISKIVSAVTFMTCVTRYGEKILPKFFPKVAQINATAALTWSDTLQKKPKKSPMFLGYFCKQICCQQLSKIAQSGHTNFISSLETFFAGNESCQNQKRDLRNISLFIISGQYCKQFTPFKILAPAGRWDTYPCCWDFMHFCAF